MSGTIRPTLSFIQVNTRWRQTAFGDSSLWTVINLEETNAPLLDMILAHSGNRLLTVFINRDDLDRCAKLWSAVDRIEELHYTTNLQKLVPLLSSLGPALNLKVLELAPEQMDVEVEEYSIPLVNLPVIFSGSLPSLRNLSLTNAAVGSAGVFKDLISFDCRVLLPQPISPVYVLEVFRESPSIESIRMNCYCNIPPGFNPPPVTLGSLKHCTLNGPGTTSLIRFMIVPPSATVSLSKPYGGSIFSNFEDLSIIPGLHILDQVSAASFCISDSGVRLRAGNDRGGYLDSGLDGLPQNMLIHFIRSFFECGRTSPGFKTTKELVFDVTRTGVIPVGESTRFALDALGLIRTLPDIEKMKLLGVPPLELFFILEYLSGAQDVQLPCRKLKRLYIESTHIRTPTPLLAEVEKILKERKRSGASLQAFAVRVESETLLPETEYQAFLTSLESLVGGRVRLESGLSTDAEMIRSRRRRFEGEDDV